MQRLILISILVIAACSVACGQATQSCANFNQLVKSTYNFRPAALNDEERTRKSAAMDKVWETVKTNKNELVPCLRQALEDPNADAWFRFDGSNLLASVDPSEASKRLQIRNYAVTRLDDVDLRVWVTTLVRLAYEGFDVSEPGERWLAYPEARYFLPQHGAYEINMPKGALFIYGTMDESQATPALQKIVSQPNHPGREIALTILLNENTPESLRIIRSLDISTFPAKAQDKIRNELSRPNVFEPRAKPRNKRQEFVEAFNAFLSDNPSLFFDLVNKVSDGERDVVATMTTEDLPLLRKMRRRMIAGGSQHAIEFYESFTKIIRTIVRANNATGQ
jgi:hypothetical protein